MNADRLRPPTSVVRAFGGDPGDLSPLPGGQGTSWRAGGVVLKPASAQDPIEWIAAVLDQVPDSTDFRVARPLPDRGGAWIAEGWSATGWVEGAHAPGRWEDGLAVSAAFHAALAPVPADPPPVPDSAWTTASNEVWGSAPIDAAHQGVRALLGELAPLLERAWTGPPAQIIHGDLGNILYAEGLPPAVIDMSPHIAPAPFADAIIVADAIAWEHAPLELGRRFLVRAGGAELLARAVLFRVLSVVHLLPDDEERITAEIDSYRPVIDIVNRQT